MKTSVLIRKARLTDGSAPADLLVSGGVITTKAPAGTLLESAAEKALDASGKLVLPGLFDIHAHLCQPGREDKELLLIRFLHLAFALGPGTVKRAGHPDVAPLYEMKKSLDWEVDKFQGFVRFEEHDGMLGAVIHPKNYILPLLRGHFCGRFPEENFMIYDAVHQAVLLYQDHKPQLLELAEPLVLPPPSAREQQFQALWKQFYKTLEIKARHNERGRMTHCPKRFWADMTELREEL